MTIEAQYRYNGAGNRVAMIDAEDVETRYSYVDLDRLTSVVGNYNDASKFPLAISATQSNPV
jgi:YD repeat-containing protein